MGTNDVTADGRGCPSDDELAAFVEHSVATELRKRIEGHIDGCPDCRAAVGHVASAVAVEPRTIDRYRLDAKLGEGGMGVVWRAWDPALERAVAIKLLHPDMHDADGRERAMREARALARLQHPNVVAVYDVGEHDGDVFIATELVDGEAMDKWQHGKPAREIVAAYAQAARGLAAAHDLGLVHRDVKPSNIFVSRDGRVRVGDFGLATNAALSSVVRSPAVVTPSSPLPKLTADGALLGTPAYMAPEQRETTEVDARADQYSLCLALAEALLGRMPQREDNKPVLPTGGATPWAAIARGLATNPSDRFAQIDLLAAALEAKPDREGSEPHLRAGAVVAVGLAAAAVIGGGIWLATRGPSKPAVATPRDAAAPAPEPRWFWAAMSSGPWQVPFVPFDVIVADAGHAIVLGMDRFTVVDLATGALTESPELDTGAGVDSLVRIGDRVVMFGNRDGAPAAWQLTVAPPTATPIPMPDAPKPEGDAPWGSAAIASPDGKHVFVCSYERVPVLRDATTLAVVRAFPATRCLAVHFSDNTHLVFSDAGRTRSLDLATGKVATVATEAPDIRFGPGAWRIEGRDDRVKVLDGKKLVRSDQVESYIDEVHWNASYALVTGFHSLVIIPLTADGDVRKVDLPELGANVTLGDTVAIVTSGRSILRIDLRTGRVQKPDRNLARLSAVAPRGGSVIASSDKLRVWRDGKVVGTTESASEIAVGAADAPVVLLDHDKLELWNPETDDRDRVQDISGFAFSVARDGDKLVISEGTMLTRGTTSTSMAPWHQLKGDDTRVTGIDVRNERIALDTKDTSNIVDLRTKSVWSYRIARHDGSCDSVGDVMMSPDGVTLGIEHGGINLLDTKTHTLRELDFDDIWVTWTFLASGELIGVTDKNVIVWNPTTQQAVGWPTQIKERPSKVGVSPDDAELAVGYEDGSLLWVDLRALRAHATPYASTLKSASLCAPPPPAATYDALLSD